MGARKEDQITKKALTSKTKVTQVPSSMAKAEEYPSPPIERNSTHTNRKWRRLYSLCFTRYHNHRIRTSTDRSRNSSTTRKNVATSGTRQRTAIHTADTDPN